MSELGCAGAPLAVDKLDGFGLQALHELGMRFADPSPATVDASKSKPQKKPNS
jgi:hypothetical protein